MIADIAMTFAGRTRRGGIDCRGWFGGACPDLRRADQQSGHEENGSPQMARPSGVPAHGGTPF